MSSEQRGAPRISFGRMAMRTVLAVVLVLIVIALILPAFQGSHVLERDRICHYHLEELGIALQNYHDMHQCYPPAYFADANGRPMHSWRVILLPYFRDSNAREVAQAYRFDEPWNGPHNRKLADKMPGVYRCPSANGDRYETSYVAIVGPETGWPGAKSLSIREIGDGASNTIAIVETVDSGINWLEPRDLSFDQAMQGINPPSSKLSPSSNHPGGANVLFFDGTVHYMPDDISRELFRALLTANGGEDVQPPTD